MLNAEHILIILELNIFQNKSENSFKIKISQKIFIEYKHTVQ